MLGNKKEQIIYQYHWKFLPSNMRSHWLLRGHMTSNNETVSRQNLWAGKIEKSMTSEGNRASLGTSHLSVYCLTIFNRSISKDHSITFSFAYDFFKELVISSAVSGYERFSWSYFSKKKGQTNNNRRSPSTAFVYSCQLEPVNRLSCLHQSLELSNCFLTFSSAIQWLGLCL